MIDARFVFIPKPDRLPMAKSTFGSTYGKTLKDLDRELGYLSAKDITVQAGFPPEKIRLDGWPYSSARPEHPAVVLQFRSRGSLMSFKATKYRSFEENLRAIALTMDALRRVDRYGIVQGEQYHGFKRLEAAAPTPPADSKEARIRNLRDNAATPGEREAAQSALDRLRAGAK